MSNNKSEGFKVQTNNAIPSNSNNSKQQSSKLQRQTSVIPTFFRWFKKPNHRKHQQFHSGRSAIEPSLRRYDSSSRESLNFNSSQSYIGNHLSPSLSCDSVVSTSTTGFAFIKPNKYGNLVEPKILSDSQIDTNSIRRLQKNAHDLNTSTIISNSENNNKIDERKPKLTLKQKYFLFESDTLKSTSSAGASTLKSSSFDTYGNYDNISGIKNNNYYNSSQIDQENIYVNDKGYSEEPVLPSRRHRSRRTVSDSSKELQSGAYVHVKGKRKAPEPPSNTNSVIISSSQQSSNPFEDSYVEPNRDNYRTLSPVSTFGRKKRKAPPPPLLVELQSNKLNFIKKDFKSPSVTRNLTPSKDSIAEEIIIEPAKQTEIKLTKSITKTTNTTTINKIQENNDISVLLNKSDIKIYSNICAAGVNQTNLDSNNRQSISADQYENIKLIDSNKNTDNSIGNMPISPVKHNKQPEIRSPHKISSNKDGNPEHLKLSNNSPDITNDTTSLTPPHSPISPRPWYKRPISTNKESVIPFKREVVLKTMEKRKSKQKESPDSGLPEVSFSRSSIFDNTNKFNLFTRQKDIKNSKDNKEKRLSNINMPNISELDREAAQILMNESKQTNWNENKSYNPPEHLKLHQEMFGGTDTVADNKENLLEKKMNFNETNDDIEETAKTTKDLINKFEIQTEGPKVTINTSYIGRTENFIGSPNKLTKTEGIVVEIEKPVQKIDSKIESDLKKTKDILDVNKTTEKESATTGLMEKQANEQTNISNKKIIKLTWSCSYCTLENPNWRIICEVCEHLKPFENHSKENEKPDVGKLIKSMPTSPQSPKASAQDWEWKAEIVKRYFQKQDSPTSNAPRSLTNSPKLQSILHKSPSPSRLPISSPRPIRNERIKQNKKENETMENNSKLLEDNKKTNENKDFQHQVGKNDISSINLEQIRIARLAKFSIPPSINNKESLKNSSVYNDKSNFLNDPNSLEMEKQRLREKIRAMNAKALAEKYPIVKKSLSLDDPTVDCSVISSQDNAENCKENQRPFSSIDNTVPVSNMDSYSPKKQNNYNKIENNFKIKTKSDQETQKSLNANENILDVLEESPKKIHISNQSNSDINNMKNISNSINSCSPNPKSGAIKKILTRSSGPSPSPDKNLESKLTNKSNDEIYTQQNKPNKVSSSCQTSSGIVKKSNDYDSKANISLNALISPIKGHKFRNGSDLKSTSPTTLEKTNDDNNIIQYQKLSDLDKEQVKEISKKLTSAEGRSNFKMTLNDESQGKGISRTDTLVLNKILRNLEQAISEGKHELAAKLAMDLAKMKVSLQVTKLKPKKSHSFDNDTDQSFIVDMFIEDRISQKGPIQISVKPSMTVRELKEKVLKDYNIPIQLQRWIINEELLYNETLTLFECGVKNNLANLYLYLLSPSSKEATTNNELNYKFTIPKTSKAFLEDDFNDENSIDSFNLNVNKYQKGAIALPYNDGNLKSYDNSNGIIENHVRTISTNTNNDEIQWECPLCTLINNPMALSCSACSKTKPLTQNEKSSISEELRKFLRGENTYNVIDCNLKSKLNNSKSTKNSNNTKTTTITITSSINNNNGKFNNNSNSNTSILNNNFNFNNKDNSNKVLLRPNEQKNDLNKTSPNRKSTEIYNIIEEVIKPVPGNLPETKANPIEEQYPQRIVTVNFSSPNITKNKYRGVDNFNPYRKDTNDIFLQQSNNQSLNGQSTSQNMNKNIKTNIETSKQESSVGRSDIIKNSNLQKNLKSNQTVELLPLLKSPYSTNHYLELLKLDYSDVVRNFEPFECPICFRNIERGNGIVLRECLHTFCKECLADTIKFNDEAQVKCPFMDKVYSCNCFLQEREIKSLVTKEIYEKHLAKSIKFAEHHIENAFHCKTANCRGWCIYEDNVNEFLCPVCNLKNCLTCGAIHDGITCKQYQDGLNDCDSNEDAKRTKEMFKEMVEKGEALNCPTCQVIMMKKWGCDWLKCSMCKTEVCWVTKGPRWGPAGKGDTSGGCMCGVNGVKCHPKCNYCH